MSTFGSRSATRLALTTLTLGLLAGCAMVDPYQRPGVWRPMGANDLNFELQVAHAADLVKGRGTDEIDATSAVAAIERMYKDKVKPLPSASASGGAGGAPAAAAGGGGS